MGGRLPPARLESFGISVLSYMRVIGLLMLILGAIGTGFFLLAFDTSVEVPTTQIGDMTVGGGRVNNLGLMADRQNGLIVSIAAAILGGILIIIGNIISPVNPPEQEQLGMEQARLQIDIQRAQLASLQTMQNPTNVIPPPPGAIPPPPGATPTYLVAKDGNNLGELPKQEVELMLGDGRLALSDYYFNSATQQWCALSDVFSPDSLSWKCKCGLIHGSNLDSCPVCLRSRAATI